MLSFLASSVPTPAIGDLSHNGPVSSLLGEGGNRLDWDRLPSRLKLAIEAQAGSRVVAARTHRGGFSPGLAATLSLEEGGRVFVKAVSAAVNPESRSMHRREALLAASLPRSLPAPRFLWALEVGDWVALGFEAVSGHTPQLPWLETDLNRVLAAIDHLSSALTPAPIAAPPIAAYLADHFTGWRHLLAAGGHPLLDPWAARNLGRLADLELGWPAAAAGDTLVHGDLRADNILLTADHVLFVDWPHACVGAAWIDLLLMLPSVTMQGGPPPQSLFARSAVASAAPGNAVEAVLAALSGYFIRGATLPAPPGLPNFRSFQRAQGEVAVEWLRGRIG